MDSRLHSAYEKITMPDGCSQRIEALLQAHGKPRNQRRNLVILHPKNGRRPWRSAAALACLMVVVGCVLSLCKMRQWQEPEASQFVQPVGEPTEIDGEGTFPLSEDGKNFLMAMCRAMPDWESYYVLDKDFWKEFLYFSFSSPEEVTGDKAKTIIGEVPCVDHTVLITRKQAEAYAALTMGCDLPLFSENEEYAGRMRYADGVYHISLSEGDSRVYVFRGLEKASVYGCDALFDVCSGQTGKVLGTVRFQLRRTDGGNGFIITSKQTDWQIPEEPVLRVEGKDLYMSLTGEKDVFQQSVRGTIDYTARQYHLPWRTCQMIASDLCSVYDDEAGETVLYRLEGESWQKAEIKTVNGFTDKDGEAGDFAISYVECGDGKPYLIDFDSSHGYYTERRFTDSPWQVLYRWEAGWDEARPAVENPCRVDLTAGEMFSLWGNVPRENQIAGISLYLHQIAFFEDGCFLAPALNPERERELYYVDPEAGQVYNLETLCGAQLDDCVGVPGTREIYCWREGEYWRIPRDTMRPEHLGKLQEDVVFASGVLGGGGATFSAERRPDGSCRVFDFLGNRFLTLGSMSLPYGGQIDWSCAEVSPDGRKLLFGNPVLFQILDCDTGKHLSIDRGLQERANGVEWLKSGEVCMQEVITRDFTIYTLQ